MFLGSAETPKYTKYGAVNPPGSGFDKTCPSELKPHLQQQKLGTCLSSGFKKNDFDLFGMWVAE